MRAKVYALTILLVAGILGACDKANNSMVDATPSSGGAGASAAAVDIAPPDTPNINPGAGSTASSIQDATADGVVTNAGQAAIGGSSLDATMPNAGQDARGTASLDADASASLDATQDENIVPSGDAEIDSEDGSTPIAVIDYGASGPFDDVKMFGESGPDGTSFLYRPDSSLGRDGYLHPVGVWGNGMGTTPDQYQDLLTLVASHGFVVIGCPDVIAEEPCLNSNLDWLVQQNEGSGPLAGQLDTSSEFSIGFSWGGGAAIDVSKRPNMKATISMHGMPPRTDPWGSMHAPLVLFSSIGDTLVPADGYVQQNYDNSQVQTFYGIIQDDEVRHMYVLDPDSFSCSAGAPEALGLGPCMSGIEEQAPVVAWLSYWIYEDQGARSYFFGDDCKLCSGRWTVQRKNWN